MIPTRTLRTHGFLFVVALALSATSFSQTSFAQTRPEFPPFQDVAKGFRQIVSTASGSSFYSLWVRGKDSQILAELPRGYNGQRFFIGTTISGGHIFAGLQEDFHYLYWKRYDKTLALMQPNTRIKASGDPESKDSVRRLWTDRVLLSVPIVCLGPTGQPVIDMDSFLAQSARLFFGYSASGISTRLATIKNVKAFPKNVEIAVEWPASGGTLRTFHYSFRAVASTPGFTPRKADARVGYFTVSYEDYGKYKRDEVPVSYITRWPLAKRDPRLKLSPPKNPIVFYVEHTVPVRYRRWVKQGVLYWNKAFEKIGILDAIVVHYQDKATGEHMEKDPEDMRYNFVRWLNNNIGIAIGPSRAHPETGEIMDADVVLTDGWIRNFWYQYNEYRPEVAMQGFSREMMSWLDRHPRWDPRIRLAPPHERSRLLEERLRRMAMPVGSEARKDPALVNHPVAEHLPDHIHDSTLLCMAADHKSRAMSLLGMHYAILAAVDDEKDEDEKDEEKKDEDEEKKDEDEEKKDEDEEKKDEDEEKKDEEKEDKDEKKKDEKKDPKPPAPQQGDVLDGIPDWFVGPLLADLVAHEIGHTLGLRHNFKASSIYTLEEINSEEIKGKKPFAGSVMDYLPVNLRMTQGEVQGDYAMIDIGPYDLWAIEYGYGLGDTKKVLARVSEPELIYGTDEDVGGSDPRARPYDFGKDPLAYGKNLIELVEYHRKHILDKFVKKGDSWSRARRGYLLTLNTQLEALSICSGWLGGTFTNRDRKGDPGERRPIDVVPEDKQREALSFVIEHAFRDEAYGLTPKIMAYMTVDKDHGYNFADEAWPVHDAIMGLQSSVLTMLMSPYRLGRVFDNELRTPSDKDAVTLPEVLRKVRDAVWSEVDEEVKEDFTARKPLISSFRRNLQREHVERLIDLAKPDDGFYAASKPLSNLVVTQLRQLKRRIETTMESEGKVDAYSYAHLSECALRIAKVLDADYIYNTDDLNGGGGFGGFLFFKEAEREEADAR